MADCHPIFFQHLRSPKVSWDVRRVDKELLCTTSLFEELPLRLRLPHMQLIRGRVEHGGTSGRASL